MQQERLASYTNLFVFPEMSGNQSEATRFERMLSAAGMKLEVVTTLRDFVRLTDQDGILFLSLTDRTFDQLVTCQTGLMGTNDQMVVITDHVSFVPSPFFRSQASQFYPKPYAELEDWLAKSGLLAQSPQSIEDNSLDSRRGMNKPGHATPRVTAESDNQTIVGEDDVTDYGV